MKRRMKNIFPRTEWYPIRLDRPPTLKKNRVVLIDARRHETKMIPWELWRALLDFSWLVFHVGVYPGYQHEAIRHDM